MNDIFFQKLNIPTLKHGPHGGFIKKAFGACFYLIEVWLDLQSIPCTVVDIVRGVETGEQDAVRFEAAFEFGGDLHGDRPCEVVEAEAGEDCVNALVSKWERLAVVQLKDVSVGNGRFGGRQVLGRKIRGNDVASRVRKFERVPAPTASKFQDKFVCRFLFKGWNPFIEPGVFIHAKSSA